MKNGKTLKRGTILCITLLAVALVLATCAVGVARYITSTERYTEMLSSDFHISSDLLDEESLPVPSNDVADMRRCGLHFHLYNYQKENTALVSELPIEYKIDAEGWSIKVWDGDTEVLPNESGNYLMPVDPAMHEYRVDLEPTKNSKDQSKVRATVTTVSPYNVTLVGDFVLQNTTIPEYKIENFANHILLTVRSNNYQGPFEINWSEAYSPDNCNVLMETWQDTSPSSSIALEPNTVYEMIFFKNVVAPLSADYTSGLTVTLG